MNRTTPFVVILNEAKRSDSIQHFKSQLLSHNPQYVTDVQMNSSPDFVGLGMTGVRPAQTKNR